MDTQLVKTRHNRNCRMVFGRYDTERCERCRELAAGAPPRRGWGYLKAQQETARMAAMREHFAPGGKHDRGECGPVCTAFDW